MTDESPVATHALWPQPTEEEGEEASRDTTSTRLLRWVASGSTTAPGGRSPSVPLRSRAGPQRSRPRSERGGTGGEPRGSEAWALQEKVRRQDDEMQSLREQYARKIANTELQCEKALREKEDACTSWYKSKRQELARMQAVVTIMQALFVRRRLRITRQMDEAKAESERLKVSFEDQVKRLQAAHADTVESLTADFSRRSAAHKAEISDLQKVRSGLESSKDRLEELLADSRVQLKAWQQESEREHQENEDLRRRLVESERTEELARKDTLIAELQEELKRVKKQMLDKRHAEAEALRKEIMDYVKFIVHILPEDWQTYVKRRGGLEEAVQLDLEGAMSRLPSPGRRRSPPPDYTREATQQTHRALATLPPVSSASAASRSLYSPASPASPRKTRLSPPSSIR